MNAWTKAARFAVEQMGASEEADFLKWLRKRAPEPDKMSLAEEWWFEKLKSGVLLPGQKDGWPRRVWTKDLANDYIARFGEGGNSVRGDQTKMGRFLQKVCSPITSGSRKKDGIRARYYDIPSLEVARECWDEYRDYSVDWDAPGAEAPEADSDAPEGDSEAGGLVEAG